MTKSLRDQLVAAGLATAGQAKKAEKQKKAEAQARRTRRTGGKGGKPATPGSGSGADAATGRKTTDADSGSSAQRARKARAEKAHRDKELAREQNSKAHQRALRAQIKQLIAQNDQRVTEKSDTDVPYNFLHKRRSSESMCRPRNRNC